MGPGALHQFTNGSQTRRKLRRGAKVVALLMETGLTDGVTAQELAMKFKSPLRTMQRTLLALVEQGDIARSSYKHAGGEIVTYRAVMP